MYHFKQVRTARRSYSFPKLPTFVFLPSVSQVLAPRSQRYVWGESGGEIKTSQIYFILSANSIQFYLYLIASLKKQCRYLITSIL